MSIVYSHIFLWSIVAPTVAGAGGTRGLCLWSQFGWCLHGEFVVKVRNAISYFQIFDVAQSLHIHKVVRKPVMGGNTVSETFTHMILFQSGSSFEKWPHCQCQFGA